MAEDFDAVCYCQCVEAGGEDADVVSVRRTMQRCWRARVDARIAEGGGGLVLSDRGSRRRRVWRSEVEPWIMSM